MEEEEEDEDAAAAAAAADGEEDEEAEDEGDGDCRVAFDSGTNGGGIMRTGGPLVSGVEGEPALADSASSRRCSRLCCLLDVRDVDEAAPSWRAAGTASIGLCDAGRTTQSSLKSPVVGRTGEERDRDGPGFGEPSGDKVRRL